MGASRKRCGIYSKADALRGDIFEQLNELFPVEVPKDAAEEAVIALSLIAKREMKNGLSEHRLSGETFNALETEEVEWTGTKVRSLVGIPRDGNVRNERPKMTAYRKGRGNWRNRTVKDSYGYLGDGAFYKGIYLEYGHGSLHPTKWFEHAIAKTRKQVTREYMEALLAKWLEK